MKKVVFSNSAAGAIQGGAMETETIQKNGAIPIRMSRVNFLRKTCFALLATGMVFSGCKKDPKIPPGVPTLRYETVPYGSNESTVKSGGEADNLVFWDYEGEYNHYFFVLGYVRNAPLAYRTAVYYNGVTNLTVEYSFSNFTQESISSSITEASEYTTTLSRSTNWGQEIGVTAGIETGGIAKLLGAKGKIEGSYKNSWGGSESESKTDSRSFSNTYETSTIKANEIKEGLTFTVGNDGEPAGMYRWALFSITDVYFSVVTDRAKTRVVEADIIFCARPTQYWEIDYDPERGGSFGKTASGELLQIPEIELSQLPDPPFREEHLPEMVFVQGGTFTMGSPEGVGDNNERPQCLVAVSSFQIGKYEITQAQWTAVMGSNPSSFKGDNLPVEMVSWDDIVGTSGAFMDVDLPNEATMRYYENGFIYKLNQLTGKSYRLPTEAEWEFAARGGNTGNNYTYSGSNDIGAVAWYDANSGGETHPVGTKQPNDLGIYDMSGNVWEWCSDWYGAYTAEPKINPTGPASGPRRINRGGAWTHSETRCRVADRNSSITNEPLKYYGFRVVHP